MKKLSNVSSQKVVGQILKWGTQIIFVFAIAVMAYLSFVENVDFGFNFRRLTTIAAIGIVLNWIVWDSYSRKNYDAVMQNDISNANNGKYSIHRRYYYARKGWKDESLRNAIREHNRRFVRSWIQDIEDLCARTEQDIIEGGYKGYDHKILIWKLKHHKYPKSGIKGPKDVLYLLSVSSSYSLQFKSREAEAYTIRTKIMKLLTSILSVAMAASISVDFLQGSYFSAIITLMLNVVILFTSLFFGSANGIKRAKIKLSTVEEACEMLEEWKNSIPSEEPYSTRINEEEQKEITLKKEPDVVENNTKNVVEFV